MMSQRCPLQIWANGAVHAGGTASPWSHLTSVENVSHNVNSSHYYSTIRCSANRVISILPSKNSMWFPRRPSTPLPGLTFRYRLASHQKSSLIFTSLELDNCSAGAVKDTPERKTNRMWCEWRKGGRGKKKKKQRPSLAGFEVAHVLLASAQPVPWIHATCINSWLTRLTCSRIRQTQIEEW